MTSSIHTPDASFVGGRLDNCPPIPLTDLLPLVDDPETFAAELRALDVPAGEVRHPAVFGPLGRSRPIAPHEARFLQTLTGRPARIALPGPYLPSRTLGWNAFRAGFPTERVALHLCRGNRTPDESTCLAGGYGPLMDLFRRMNVGTYLLELCTPRVGELEVLRSLSEDRRIGVGVVNQKHVRIETMDGILVRAEAAIRLFGAERVLLNPDCGFATFADNPLAAPDIAERKLAAIAAAARMLRDRHPRT